MSDFVVFVNIGGGSRGEAHATNGVDSSWEEVGEAMFLLKDLADKVASLDVVFVADLIKNLFTLFFADYYILVPKNL